jgi:hypothetical protein
LKKTAQSFCAQAEDFYKTSFHAHEMYAKPLLLYYSMLREQRGHQVLPNKTAAARNENLCHAVRSTPASLWTRPIPTKQRWFSGCVRFQFSAQSQP